MKVQEEILARTRSFDLMWLSHVLLRSLLRTVVALLGAAVTLLPTVAGAEMAVEAWVQRYNGPENGNGYAKAVAVDAKSNVYVTGYSTNSDSGYDYATIAYSSAGVPLWTNRYNGPENGDDRAIAMAVDTNDNVYVTGYSLGSDSGYDYASIAYSSAGAPLWTNRYSGPGNGDDRATAMAVDTNGNVYVTGYSANSARDYDWVTIAYSSVGLPLWTNRYNGPGDWADYAFAMAADTNGNVYVTGYSANSASDSDWATIAYSSAGLPLWTNRYNAPGKSKDDARTVAVDAGKLGGEVYYDTSYWSNFLRGLKFTRDVHNPIMSPTLPWEGDNIGDPVVIEENTELRMYYSGFTYSGPNAVGLATSPKTYPPTSWTKQGAVFAPNPQSGQWDSGWVRFGSIFKAGSTYYLYYEGTPSPGEGGTMRIGLATSTNGINFTRNESNPILSPSGDPEAHVENPTVIQTDATHWYMYYSYRGSVTLPGIRVATSSDGVNWTKVPGDVMSKGTGGEWDDTYIEHAQIYYIYDHYVLVYEGYGGSGNEPWACGLAYSTSPTTNFTKFSGNPFFQKSGVSGAFDQFHVATPTLFLQDDVCYLFFQGGNDRDSYGSSKWKFGLARATTTITTPSPLAAGTVGVAYNQTLTASGVTAPSTWTIASGNLPSGLSLSSGGVISGTPQAVVVANFRVRVTGGDTLCSERDFSLTINGAPTITSQPQSRTNMVGTTATSSVTATGTTPLRYYWRFNGNPINGATTSAYSLGSVQSGNAGSYDVLVVNAYDRVTSQVASLTVWMPATITTQPQSRTNVVRTPASFTVAATGTPPLNYQWRFNGLPIDGATTTRYSLGSVQTNHAGNYDVVVTNLANSVTSLAASLMVIDPLRFEATNGAVAVVNGEFQMLLVGMTLTNPVVIEASTNLVDWEPVFTNATPSNPLFYSELYDSNYSGRFYRALEIPIVPNNPSPLGMALIPAGSFTMGDTLDGNLNDDAVPMSVTVSAFYMDRNLVSYSQWTNVYAYATNHGYSFSPWAAGGKAWNHPVQTVDWYDSVKWSNARSEQAGLTPVYYTDAGLTQVYTNGEPTTLYPNWAAKGYRLPTEAEWEKAARGGLSEKRFPWGDTISESQANYYSEWYGGVPYHSYDVNGYQGFNTNYNTGGEPYTSPVGSFAPNGYGLYDMAGNILEWCWDWYGTPYGQPTTDNPTGPAGSLRYRVLRGGAWHGHAGYARCAYRSYSGAPSDAYYGFIGFRCARGL